MKKADLLAEIERLKRRVEQLEATQRIPQAPPPREMKLPSLPPTTPFYPWRPNWGSGTIVTH